MPVIDEKNKLSINTSRYRTEIDSLRAFAVITVIINHFNKDILPGGYLGVDIFFVISGFVITSSLYQRPSKNFKDFLSGFYERRIKRLVPALLVFVLIMSIAICLFNPNPALSLITGLTSLFGLSNLYLLKQSTDYFAQSTELNVFTHTWSLGVEEQFYILFPCLIWFSGFGRQTKNGVRNLFLIIGILAIVSLIGFLYLYPINQSAAYFLMPTRFWEMAAGSSLFIGFQKRKSIEQTLEKVPPLLVLILIIGIMYIPLSLASASTIAIIILSGVLIACLKKHSKAYTIFTHPKIVYIGLISYSLYLWHWGILSISRWTIGIHWWSVPFQIMLILGLADISYKYIETPFRKGNNWFGKRWKASLTGGEILVLASLLVVMDKTISQQLYLGKRDIQIPRMETFYSSSESEFRRNNCSSSLKMQVEDPLDACYKNTGKESSNTLIALLGDSMAESLYKIIDIEDSSNRLSTFYSTRNSCLIPQPSSSSTNNCKKWSDAIVKKVNELSKEHLNTIIIINGYYQGYFDKSRSIFQPLLKTSNDYKGYLKAVSNLAKNIKRNGKDISLVLTMPIPIQALDPYPICFKEWFRVNTSSICETGTPKRYANLDPREIRSQFEKIASTTSNVYIFDPSLLICLDDFCRISNSKGAFLYTDDRHLSDNGAKYIYPEYERTKNKILSKSN